MRPVRGLLLVPVLAVAGLAPAASAATWCVGAVTCPAGGVVAPDVQTAAAAATQATTRDVVRVGAGTFTLPTAAVKLRDGDALIGAGDEDTILTGGLDLAGQAAVTDLTVRPRAGQAVGILSTGATLRGVDVDGADLTAAAATGIRAGGATRVEDADVALAAGTGVVSAGSGAVEVSDSVIAAPTGARAGAYGLTLLRTRVQAHVGLLAPAGAGTVDTVLMQLAGDGAVGIVAGPGPQSALPLTVTHATIAAGGAAGSVGIAVRAGCAGEAAAGIVDQTIVTGVAVALERASACAAAPATATLADLAVTRSVFDPGAVTSTGPGAAFIAAPVAADPGLGVDLTPLPGSPVVDAGDADEVPGLDVDGDPRPADGDGDGSAVPDLGAIELAPQPDLSGLGGAYLDDGGVDYTDEDDDDGGVLGESDTSAKRRPTAVSITVARVKDRPRRFLVRVRVTYPKRTSARGGKVTVAAQAGRRRLRAHHLRLDARGRSTFTLVLPKGVARRQVGLRPSFAGTATLKARTGRWTGLY